VTEAIPDATAAALFAARLLDWHDAHGRHDLPWQQPIDAYRVWVSEIMLQQTQVGTVIPYFQRFIARFPDVRTLADAPEDEVLHHWTGLGYYARARNLHRSARIVRDHYGGALPQAPEELAALPGIGRSTAGAICAIAWGQRTPILDGNVKRVLSRYFAIAGEVTRAATLAELWAVADALTPAGRCGDYTQAIMDLGATVCTRTRPACALCPLAAACRARADGNPARFPAKKRGRAIPERRCQMLVIRSPDGAVLLEKRPATGIWGGLWSFPEIPEREDPAIACDRLTGTAPASLRRGTPFRHTFSHFHLDATPVFLRVGAVRARVMEDQRLIWYKPGHERLGFAAPVKRLLDGMTRETAELEMDQQ
jgi:A/G-specific adenine glycosylase